MVSSVGFALQGASDDLWVTTSCPVEREELRTVRGHTCPQFSKFSGTGLEVVSINQSATVMRMRWNGYCLYSRKMSGQSKQSCISGFKLANIYCLLYERIQIQLTSLHFFRKPNQLPRRKRRGIKPNHDQEEGL